MNYKPEYIGQIASSIKSSLNTSIYDVRDISERTGIIAVNGRIEAARSGREGVGFRIVANEFSRLSDEIAGISIQMQEQISQEVRGQRLSQAALSIMDAIDRNLYERTCDVRWWRRSARRPKKRRSTPPGGWGHPGLPYGLSGSLPHKQLRSHRGQRPPGAA